MANARQSIRNIFVAMVVCWCGLTASAAPYAAASRSQTALTASATYSLMNRLEEVLSQREMFVSRKEAKLAALRHTADTTCDISSRFYALGDLLDEYAPFNTDSAYAISLEREAVAKALGNNVMLMNARMNRANILNATGMYKETVNLMDSIRYELLPDYLHPYYFHIKRTVYGGLADFAAFQPERRRYLALTDLYRDSLLTVNDPASMAYAINKADKLNAAGQPSEAIAVLTHYCDNNELSEHEHAIFAWSLSEAYSLLGDVENQKNQLIISSIYDMTSAVREYVSLRQLALMLYKEGDLERARRYMTIAVDDAAKCNARQRIVEINASYPMINDIYINEIQAQKSTLSRTVVIITVLTLVLAVLLFYTIKQKRRVSEARCVIQEAYEQLQQLNEQLSQSNKKLHDANTDIAEISQLKEVYVGRYMDQCLVYIEKLDNYRKSVARLVNSGKIDSLKKSLKATSGIEDEFKAFYAQFDKTFLNLFPSFVEEFNNLLLPEEAIIPKKTGYLNPELRIYALIRLGITDSESIARFLRYSVTTIYNYRTRIRNKARGNRNTLDRDVMTIGRL